MCDLNTPIRGAISVALVGEVLEKLLLQAISDPDPGVRRVLGQVDVRFDSLLAENRDALRYLLIALNDEVFEIRDYAIAVIGRLAVRNPAHVLPAVRKTLTHLLSGLEFSGAQPVHYTRSVCVFGTCVWVVCACYVCRVLMMCMLCA